MNELNNVEEPTGRNIRITFKFALLTFTLGKNHSNLTSVLYLAPQFLCVSQWFSSPRLCLARNVYNKFQNKWAWIQFPYVSTCALSIYDLFTRNWYKILEYAVSFVFCLRIMFTWMCFFVLTPSLYKWNVLKCLSLFKYIFVLLLFFIYKIYRVNFIKVIILACDHEFCCDRERIRREHFSARKKNYSSCV